MKRNVYMTLLTIVTVACIIGGSLHHIGGITAMHPDPKDENWFVFRGRGDVSREVLYSEETALGGEPAEPKALRIDGEIMDVQMIRGDAFRVEYTGGRRYTPDVTFEGDTIRITQKVKGVIFGIDFSGFNNTLLVTVPESSVLDDLEVTTDTGGIDVDGIRVGGAVLTSDTGEIACRNFQAKSTVLSTDTGAIGADASALGDLKAESDTGAIAIANCTFDDADIENDTGAVELSLADLKAWSLDLSSDTGRITVNGEKVKHAYRYDGHGSARVRVRTDTGRISLGEE